MQLGELSKEFVIGSAFPLPQMETSYSVIASYSYTIMTIVQSLK